MPRIRRMERPATGAGTNGRPPAVQLYDLERDISESTNLEAEHPGVVERLLAELEAIRSGD